MGRNGYCMPHAGHESGVNRNSCPRRVTHHLIFPPECEFHHTGYEAFVVKSSGSSLLAPAAHTHPGRGIFVRSGAS